VIFVGGGALLGRALRHARDRGHRVDLVCTWPGGSPPGAVVEPSLVRETSDINALAGELRAACDDGVIFSIDNKLIFRAPVLDLGLRIYNIHGGPLPGYRGLPLAMVAYAILGGERQYGVSLHEVEAGVDTGAVLAERRFPVASDDGFEDVMLQVVEACHRLFVDNLDAVLAGRLTARRQPPGQSHYYGLRALRELSRHRAHPNYARATDLGMFADFYPEAAEAWR
jgi:methionyl-tRNA formyltransferase